ncbi:hypothetical protein DQW50_04730 [Halorubrum sp. 48-1-W]|uniref:winged helix-turn-helix domain-containing protein n=1 Tax=Halorubrum sp. 48-1-W TaxID=2249761 RepID=UPI000DCBBB28|nr:hypothetical protein DQW50_04730 [Halorubrum sp. 48-1-W]
MGCDAPAWTPALAREYLEETYSVEYSISSCRRFLKEAGLSYQNHLTQPPNPTIATKKRSTTRRKKAAEDGRHSSVSRSNGDVCPSRIALRGVSVWYAARRRSIRSMEVDAFVGRDHRGR